jgi:uncharacterized membrane protein YjjB (DUF3815 family)
MDKIIVVLENQIAIISPKILWLVFILVFIFAMIFSIILNHHWRLYETTNLKMHQGRLLYFWVLGFLFLSSLVSLIIFQNLT